MEPDISALLEAAGAGNANAPRELFAALYRELHQLAERQLRHGGPAATLSATTLLHEAYLSLSAREGAVFPDRARFIGYAARAMRGLVVDHARRSRAEKRGGGAFEITLADEVVPAAEADHWRGVELERLSDALDELAALEPSLAQLVDLHYFCGYTLGEIAELRRTSERTVQRDFRKARLLLQRALLDDASGTSPLQPSAPAPRTA